VGPVKIVSLKTVLGDWNKKDAGHFAKKNQLELNCITRHSNPQGLNYDNFTKSRFIKKIEQN